MPKLFSLQENKILRQADKAEKDLNKFICDNWSSLFPQYRLIKSEFVLSGSVRSTGKSGRIDILAYNPETKRFVVFELKKNYDKNIKDQAGDYRDYIEDNFSDIYLLATQKYHVELPQFFELAQDEVELVLLAKKFDSNQIDKVKKLNQKGKSVTLIKYYWFANDFVFLDYVNNDPDDLVAESTITKKTCNLKNASLDPNVNAMEQYFGLYDKSKEIFSVFLDFLKQKGNVKLDAQQSKLKIVFNGNLSFSAIHKGGRGSRNTFLQMNTDFDIMPLSENIKGYVEDRVRPKGKKKGSLGVERYEIYFCDTEDMRAFCDFISDKL